jgi:hypothetical protein
VKSIVMDGREVADASFELRESDATVVVTLTDRPAQLTGVARLPDGTVDRDAVIIVFPADPGLWSDYGPNPRRVRSMRATAKGTYSFTLPAGDYYVAAIREARAAEWQDPGKLESLARVAAHVHLADGDERTQDVTTLTGAAR